MLKKLCFEELLPDAACVTMRFAHGYKRRALKCFIAIKMEPNLQYLQKREAKKRAGNPFTSVLVIFLAISVSISVRRNGLEMRI
jgi:hypothetical protein